MATVAMTDELEEYIASLRTYLSNGDAEESKEATESHRNAAVGALEKPHPRDGENGQLALGHHRSSEVALSDLEREQETKKKLP
jgi:hypothetical protein